MSLDTIGVFAVSKLAWIKRQQLKLREQERETPRDYVDRESHYLWGKRYLLTVKEVDQPPSIQLRHRRMILQVRPGTDVQKKEDLVQEWYRDRIKEAVPVLLAQWEPRIGVTVDRVYIRRMKTKWGS